MSEPSGLLGSLDDIELLDNTEVQTTEVLSPHCVNQGRLNCTDLPDYQTCSDNIPNTSSMDIPGTDSELLHLLNTSSSPDTRKRKRRRKSNLEQAMEASQSAFSSPTMRDAPPLPHDNTPLRSDHSPHRPSQAVSPPLASQEQIIILESDSVALFTNDIKFAKYLDSSPFKALPNLTVTKNFTKRMYILRFTNTPSTSINELLQVTTLGDYSIKCRLPLSQQTCRGVIGPVSLEISMSELFDYVHSSHPTLSSVKRLNKGSSKTPSLSVLLVFTGAVLPPSVTLGFQRYQIRTYVPSPWQCFNCQRYGHNASDCRSKPRCLLCAGGHKTAECPLKTNNSPAMPIPATNLKCANCSGNHTANYGGCNRMQEAREVEKVRAHHRLSYRDAIVSVRSQSSTSANVRPSPILPLSVRPPVPFIQPPHKQSMSIATQTDPLPSSTPDTLSLATNFSVLLVKVLQCLDIKGTDSKLLDILSIVKLTLGVDISNVFQNASPHSSGTPEVVLPSPTYDSHSDTSPTYNSHPKPGKLGQKPSKPKTDKRDVPKAKPRR